RFSESALEIFVFLNQLLRTSFFLTALENFAFLNRRYPTIPPNTIPTKQQKILTKKRKNFFCVLSFLLTFAPNRITNGTHYHKNRRSINRTIPA
ncbi:MAG: hypothetical protein RR752_03210, partial [Mucinivorans sp.]